MDWGSVVSNPMIFVVMSVPPCTIVVFVLVLRVSVAFATGALQRLVLVLASAASLKGGDGSPVPQLWS